MIEITFLIAYAVFFIHVTTWEGHIFEGVANWLDLRVPEKMIPPLYGCPICMSPWWGSLMLTLLWLVGRYDFEPVTTILILFAAGGINTVNAILGKWYQEMKKREENES